jgi:hypothetical protein
MLQPRVWENKMKSFWTKYWKKIGVATSLLVMAGVFTHCISEDNMKFTLSSDDGYDIPESLPDDTESAVSSPLQSSSTVALKNFEQIHATFSALTGIPTDQNDVENEFDNVKTLLPTGNNIENFGSKVQVSVVRLAATYCDELVDNGNLRGNVWPNVNFGASPTNNFPNDDAKLGMINDGIEKFWGENLQTGMDRDAAAIELLGMYEDLIVGEPNNSATTRKMVKAVCTATLSSIQTIIL